MRHYLVVFFIISILAGTFYFTGSLNANVANADMVSDENYTTASLWSWAKDLVGKIGSGLKKVGGAIVSGVQQGVEWAWDKLKDFGKWIWDNKWSIVSFLVFLWLFKKFKWIIFKQKAEEKIADLGQKTACEKFFDALLSALDWFFDNIIRPIFGKALDKLQEKIRDWLKQLKQKRCH